ncbi:hypothetical protein BDK51DRAFT_30640 [Blyttiomyces helicus]|uniref:Uncharacterized protein n=1 Tax=Blyttiomyces helicus TaxID=388810 RepID=A0A4P9VTJ3_9FUNG|nr:hypothetical protein BDK51DRAFT_30640 [Blyttiomyces helicus]|eukprot:RKO82851.1 hypothetical protein BDK51DRAFT_30640 [Blyttiomyces helicus]
MSVSGGPRPRRDPAENWIGIGEEGRGEEGVLLHVPLQNCRRSNKHDLRKADGKQGTRTPIRNGLGDDRPREEGILRAFVTCGDGVMRLRFSARSFSVAPKLQQVAIEPRTTLAKWGNMGLEPPEGECRGSAKEELKRWGPSVGSCEGYMGASPSAGALDAATETESLQARGLYPHIGVGSSLGRTGRGEDGILLNLKGVGTLSSGDQAHEKAKVELDVHVELERGRPREELKVMD